MKLKNTVVAACALAIIGVTPAFAAKTLIKDNALASYYGAQFHGRPTSSGEIFDMYGMTAAHRTLPFGTMLELTNLDNGNSVIVRVNDRGPFVEGRDIDVSLGAAEKLGMINDGVARVSISLIDESDSVSTAPASPSVEGLSAVPQAVAQSLAVPQAIAQSLVAPQASTQSPAAQQAGAQSPAVPQASTRDPAVQQAPLLPVTETPPSTIYEWNANPPAPAASYTEEPSRPAPVWRIQLGAFAREENALRLVRMVRAAGLEPAYERGDDTIRVVIAGVQDSELENIKSVLSDAGIYDYIVRREQ